MAQEVTRPELLARLRELNPRATPMVLAMYADAFEEYRAAQANISAHGSIVSHPKTGAPIANPYCVVRDRAAKTLRDLRVNDGDLWAEPE